MNGWEGIPQASAQGNERKRSAKPTAVNEARPAYEVRFAERKPCKAGERPQCIIRIPCPRTDALYSYRARGCRGDASPLRSSTRTFRTIRTIRTIRTARTTWNRARGPGNANFSDDSDPAPPGCAVASSTHCKGRHERSGKNSTGPPCHRWSHSIREIAVSNFRAVQVSDLLRVWGA